MADDFHQSMDGAVWAAEFRKTALKLGYSDMDEGWLIGWFANAIMRGYDTANKRREKADSSRKESLHTAPPAGVLSEAEIADSEKYNNEVLKWANVDFRSRPTDTSRAFLIASHRAQAAEIQRLSAALEKLNANCSNSIGELVQQNERLTKLCNDTEAEAMGYATELADARRALLPSPPEAP